MSDESADAGDAGVDRDWISLLQTVGTIVVIAGVAYDFVLHGNLFDTTLVGLTLVLSGGALVVASYYLDWRRGRNEARPE